MRHPSAVSLAQRLLDSRLKRGSLVGIEADSPTKITDEEIAWAEDILATHLDACMKQGIHPNLSEAVEDALSFALRREKAYKRDKIRAAPGSSWMKYIDFFYSKKFVEGTIKPVLADWHHEYFEALKEGRPRKARWVSVRYHRAMIKTLWLGKAWEMAEKVFALIKS